MTNATDKQPVPSQAARIRGAFSRFGLPRIIIVSFLVFLWLFSSFLKIPFPALFSDSLVRLGMNGILTLAMLPSILAGTGLFFGLPLGIICGLLGALISIEMNLRGFTAFFAAIAISVPFSIIVGYAYGWLLNQVKGSEMTVSTYVGFAFVSLMCFGWIVLPFRSPEMAWAIGAGIRTTISLEGRFSKVLNEFLAVRIGNLFIPTGLLLFFAFMCFLVWIFFRTKSGLALRSGGINPRFAKASGIDVDKTRIIGTVVSTILGGVGIIVYSQSFTFLQLYQAPMYMGFIAAAAILIGGATLRFGTITHVVLGTFLFQSILVVALPVANTVATLGSLAEISRIVVSNGVILYALAQKGGAE